jgi:hypothetical protein
MQPAQSKSTHLEARQQLGQIQLPKVFFFFLKKQQQQQKQKKVERSQERAAANLLEPVSSLQQCRVRMPGPGAVLT